MLDTATTLAVLGAAVIHASWNAAIKRAGQPLYESALMHVWLVPPALVLLPWAGWPSAFTFVCAVGSALVHCVYFHVLAAAYRHVDLSITYPILRGSAPALTALGAVLLMDEHPSVQGWGGILMICGGVVAMGLLAARASPRAAPVKAAIGWAMCTALTIVAYTLIDSAGVRSAPQAWMYVTWLMLLQGPFVCGVLLLREGAAFTRYARHRGVNPLFNGLASMGGYGIALWAMTQAPVAAVAALRETSILFALLIARFTLGEKPGPGRWIAALVIVAGVIALRSA